MEKYILISSENRTSGSSSNFQANLNNTVKDIKCLKLQQAYVPYSFYVAGGQSLIFEEQLGGGPITVTLPQQHYSFTTMASELKTLLDANTLNAGVYTVTYDSSTGKFTISSTINFRLLFDSSTAKSAKFLGFNSPSTTAYANAVTSTNVANKSEPYLILSISPWENNVLSNDNIQKGWVLPINGNFGDQLIYTEGMIDNQLTWYSKGRNIYSFDVKLLYPDGSPVDLNGNEITLKFSYDSWKE